MAETKEIVYVPGAFAKERTFPDGGSFISLSFKCDQLRAFLQSHETETGYVNMTIRRKKELDRLGNTHAVTLYTPKPRTGPPKHAEPITEEDIPFAWLLALIVPALGLLG